METPPDDKAPRDAVIDELAEQTRRRPEDAQAWSDLGVALVRSDRIEQAEPALRKALSLRPEDAAAWNNLATALRLQGQIAAAAEACRRALAIAPDYAKAKFHLGDCLMLEGRIEEAFELYEARRLIPEVTLPGRDLSAPEWRGEDPAGRRILVIAEQGLGDTLMYCRFATRLSEMGARVVLAVQTPLKGLCASLPGDIDIVGSGEPLAPFDLHVPLLSLPHLFRTDAQSIPAAVPYLRPTETAGNRWREALGPKSGFRVAIAWQGTPGTEADRGRSFPLSMFSRLSRHSSVGLFSFQKGAGVNQLANWPGLVGIRDIGSDCTDFDDTAAALMEMDLVITPDTALAHLAGALGLPVWIALRFVPAARWGVGRPASPWYPTARLFRQTARGGWDGVFAAISGKLDRRLEA